jgi:hypothetical protein
MISRMVACGFGLLALLRRTQARHSPEIWLPLSLAAVLVLCAPASAFTLKEVGEWVVSCDNGATCSLVNASQLTQLRVAQPSPFGMSRICIQRRAEVDGRPQVFVTLRSLRPTVFGAAQDDRLLRVVGAAAPVPDVAMISRGSDHWQVPVPMVDPLLGSLGNATQLHVVTRAGVVLERLSLQGIDQALSMIDRAQGRSGTVSALREKGSAPPASPPPTWVSQAVVTAPLPKLPATVVPSPEALRLRRAICGSPGSDPTGGYRLLGDHQRPDRILWVTPCNSPQGLPRAYFVIEDDDGSARAVDFPGAQPERPSGQAGLLTFPELDAETGRLRELWREPVPPGADTPCLIQRLWGWTGRSFELAEERRSLSCAGTIRGYWAKTYSRPLVTPARDGVPVIAASFQPPC